MSEPAPNQNGQTTYFPIDLDAFESLMVGLDLYLKHDSSEKPALYCAQGVVLSPEDRARLVSQGTRFLLAPYEQHDVYRAIVLKSLEATYDSEKYSPEQRRKRVRNVCEKFIREALVDPVRPGAVTLVSAVSSRIASWLATDAEEMLDMIEMARHDFQTAAHMLNVGLGCGMLMSQISPGNADQIQLALEGGLLHDLGKRCLDESLLNKQGSLTPVEWDSVQRHPTIGHDELLQRGDIANEVLEMVRDHHERLDGGGYPNGISGEEIGLFARICAIVDVFDAITSSRPYRNPMHPFDALDVMREGVGAHFDPVLFEVWTAIVADSVELTPPESLPDRVGEDGVTLNLSKLLQWGPGGMTPPMPNARRNSARNWDSDRRVNTRKSWRNTIQTTILLQNPSGASSASTPSLPLNSVDISISGIQLVTPTAFTQGDLLLLQLPGRDGKPIVRHGRVVRVRQDGDNCWIAGVEFVAPGQIADTYPAPDQSDESDDSREEAA